MVVSQANTHPVTVKENTHQVTWEGNTITWLEAMSPRQPIFRYYICTSCWQDRSMSCFWLSLVSVSFPHFLAKSACMFKQRSSSPSIVATGTYSPLNRPTSGHYVPVIQLLQWISTPLLIIVLFPPDSRSSKLHGGQEQLRVPIPTVFCNPWTAVPVQYFQFSPSEILVRRSDAGRWLTQNVCPHRQLIETGTIG